MSAGAAASAEGFQAQMELATRPHSRREAGDRALNKAVVEEKKFFDKIPFNEKQGKAGAGRSDGRWKNLQKKEALNVIATQKMGSTRRSSSSRRGSTRSPQEFPSN